MIAGRAPVSLGRRITLGFSVLILLFLGATVLLEVVGIPGTAHQGRFARNRATVLNDMELVSELLRERMVSWFRERRVDVHGLASGPLFRRALEQQDGRIQGELVRELQEFQKSHPDFRSVAILHPDGGRIRAAIGAFQGARAGSDLGIPPGRLPSLVVPGYQEVIELRSGTDRKPQLRVIRQILAATDPDRIIALVVADSDVESAMSRLVSVVGGRLSRKWECVIAGGSGGIIASFLNLGDRSAIQALTAERGTPFVPVRLALSGMDASYDGPDQSGRLVLAFHRQIKVDRDVVLALVITMDRALALRTAWDELFRQVLTLLVMLVVGVGLCILFARQLSRPIQELALAARRVASGDLGARAETGDRSEVGQLAEVFNGMLVQLEARRHELEAARDAADAANRAKSEFLANMSHEIRTPMNAILGLTHLTLQADPTDRQRDYLLKAQASAEALLGIINDILDFSKIEARKLQMDTRDFLLDEVFSGVIQLVAPRSAEKSLEFMLDTAPDVPQSLVGDPLRLGQVLTNLCSNAVKFTEQGEIIVMTVRRAEAEGGRVTLQFSVRDTGIGMTPEQVGELFRPFSQVDPSSTRRFGGTGLGLAISRNLVELMGGEIWVESEPGRGSTFTFTATFGIGSPRPSLGAATPGEAGKLRVLIVDDSPSARDILKGLVSGLGYEARAVDSAASARAELKRGRYDLILMDWRMPGMDGLQAVAHLRSDPELMELPRIILVTAFGDETLQRRAEEAGLAGYLAKPVTASSLLDAIMGAMEGRSLRTVAAGGSQGALASPELSGLRVLLVEDNVFNQQVAVEFLGLMGVEATLASDGQQALDSLASGTFDVVLMDLQMPGMDGYEATRRIRMDERHRGLPILALTAHAMVQERDRCLALGMDGYLTKPISPGELGAALAQCTRRRPPRSALSLPGGPSEDQGAPGRDLPGISWEDGLESFGGRVDLFGLMLRRFVELKSGAAQELRAALAAGDREGAHRMAHSMIATAGTIGARELMVASRALQDALGPGGDPAALDPALERYEAALKVVLEGLRA